MFANLINGFYKSFENLPFDTLVYTVLGSYLAVFALTFVLCLCFKGIKQASKRPFLCFTNAYTGLICAVFLFKCELAESLVAGALFWVVGYILFGFLCLVSRTKEKPAVPKLITAEIPTRQPAPVPPVARTETSTPTNAPKNSVRLEHASAVTDKLLSKNLSKADRQELEKLKNTLAVLQIKGSLTPQEAEILNENFNALLKLMAKYNV